MAIAPVPISMMPGAMESMSAQFTGLTADQAYNQFVDKRYESKNELQIGYTTVTGDKPAISGNSSTTISDISNPNPEDAWNDYVENNPDVSETTGGIRSGSFVSTIALSVIEKTDLSPEAVVPVAIPLDAAIVAASQAFGVSIKATELEIETKRILANSIVETSGMVYDKAKNLVLAWKDKLGNILFPKSVLDSVSDALTEEGIGGETGRTSGLVTNLPQPIAVYGPGTIVTYPNNWQTISDYPTVYARENSESTVPYIFAVSSSQLSVGAMKCRRSPTSPWETMGGYTVTATVDGIVAHGWATWGSEYWGFGIPGDVTVYDALPDNNSLWTTVYGEEVGNYPEGTSKSLAPSYTSATLPTSGSIVTDNGGRIPVIPINIPSNPYDATGSTIDPTSPTDDNNAGVIYPGIPQEVPDTDNPDGRPKQENAPIPLPIPDTNISNPDVPLTDSSVINSTLVNELVESLADTLEPQPSQSSGVIPIPYMPGIVTPGPDPEVDPPTIQYPSIVPASGSGLIHVYNPTPGEFVSFGNWLWVTYADSTIEKIWNNPFDGIIGAFELYCTPPIDGSDNIRSGFLVCPTTAGLVRQRYIEIDCGTVVVPEYYGNYLDYSPYSQAYIYLPFIGINEVSIDDVVGHAVKILYRVDCYNGSCIAMIFVAKNGYQNLCYQFAGNCAVEVPLAGGSQAAIKAGVLQAEAYARATMQTAQIQKTANIGTGVLHGAQSGGGNILGGIIGALAGGAAGYISGEAGVASAQQQAAAQTEAARYANKSSVQHSGQFGASHGAMGMKTPFIIIRNPVQVKVTNYNEEYGYPAHKRVIVGGCHGFLRAQECHVISAHATDEEKIAIEQALKSGVFVD